MNILMKTSISALIGIIFTASVYADGNIIKVNNVELPGIPIELTDPPKKQKPVVTTKSTKNEQQPAVNHSETSGVKLKDQYPMELVVAPGVNEIIKISRGYANRIVTPYFRPKIRSSNPIEVKYDANIAYVTTDSEKPVGVFISSSEVEGSEAISLTLVPVAIPPREIRLKMSQGFTELSNMRAKKWETSNDYIDIFKKLFKNIALGDVPKGYALNQNPQGSWGCTQQGLETSLGQVLDGHHIRVLILVAQNTNQQRIEVDEESCYKPGFLAATAWPRPVLDPGEKTELYVAIRKNMPTQKARKRPALVEANNGH